jgi:hypothetical protein
MPGHGGLMVQLNPPKSTAAPSSTTSSAPSPTKAHKHLISPVSLWENSQLKEIMMDLDCILAGIDA